MSKYSVLLLVNDTAVVDTTARRKLKSILDKGMKKMTPSTMAWTCGIEANSDKEAENKLALIIKNTCMKLKIPSGQLIITVCASSKRVRLKYTLPRPTELS